MCVYDLCTYIRTCKSSVSAECINAHPDMSDNGNNDFMIHRYLRLEKNVFTTEPLVIPIYHIRKPFQITVCSVCVYLHPFVFRFEITKKIKLKKKEKR